MKEKKERAVIQATASLLRTGQEGTVTDPLGSYTGVPQNPYEVPVQDADDL